MNETTAGTAFLELELTVEVWLATEKVPLEQLLNLEPGGILPLSHDPDGPVDLVVNGIVVASGELVVVEGRFGFRVTRTAQQKLDELESDAVAAESGPPERTDAAEDEPTAQADASEQSVPEEETVGSEP